VSDEWRWVGVAVMTTTVMRSAGARGQVHAEVAGLNGRRDGARSEVMTR
jgi:hypothetical protein